MRTLKQKQSPALLGPPEVCSSVWIYRDPDLCLYFPIFLLFLLCSERPGRQRCWRKIFTARLNGVFTNSS